MFDWIVNLFDTFAEIITGVVTALYDFYAQINLLSDDIKIMTTNNGGLGSYLGAFRFVVGDLIYKTYYFIALFGCFYTIYVLVKGVIKLLAEAKQNAFTYIKPQ